MESGTEFQVDLLKHKRDLIFLSGGMRAVQWITNVTATEHLVFAVLRKVMLVRGFIPLKDIYDPLKSREHEYERYDVF